MTAAGGGAGCPRTPPELLGDSPSRSRIQRRRLTAPSEAEEEPRGGHRRGFSSEPERGYSETEDAEAEEECASWAGSAAGAEAEADEESPSWTPGERRWREAENRGDLDESPSWSSGERRMRDAERRAVREGRDHDESPLQELKRSCGT